MRAEVINGKTFLVVSRRNLLTLLAKLNGHPPDSACMISGGQDANGYFILAEEDEKHYADRQVPEGMAKFGLMTDDTELAIPALDEEVRRAQAEDG